MSETIDYYNKHLQKINPIFKYTDQDVCVQGMAYEDNETTIDTDCFQVNGYEFAKQFIHNKAYHHLFTSLTLIIDLRFSTVYIDDMKIYSGLDALNAIQDDMNPYNQIEDLAHYFYTNHLNQASIQDFLDTLNDFNKEYLDAIYDLEEYLNQHKDKLVTLPVNLLQKEIYTEP